MCNIFDEGNLRFDFSSCGAAERFDVNKTNPCGMKSVDFFVDSSACVYFIEVKDFQHPKTPKSQRDEDCAMLCSAVTEKNSLFAIEMGEKIKNSLLRNYALGKTFTKKVEYLLFINLDKLGEFERGMLAERISGHVPTGLNDKQFTKFTQIRFELVDSEQLKKHGITCEEIKVVEGER
jgi:hypothetical protein